MRNLMPVLIAAALVVPAESTAKRPVEIKKGPSLGFVTETLVDDLEFRAYRASPSGRYLAWREGTGIRLHDGLEGVTIDLPGPRLDPEGTSGQEHIVVSETHVSWRRVVSNWRVRTERYLYDIRKATLVEVYRPSAANEFPIYLLPDWLVWRGLIDDGAGGVIARVLAYRIQTGEVMDLTPGDPGVGWFHGDGTRFAWTGDAVNEPGQGTIFTTVRTHDLATGRTDLLDEGPDRHTHVRVDGDRVSWFVPSGFAAADPRELRTANLRPVACGTGPEIAVLLPTLFVLRRRRQA